MYVIQSRTFRPSPQLFEDWLKKIILPGREIIAGHGKYLTFQVSKKANDVLLVSAYWLPDNEQPRIEYTPGVGFYQPDLDKDPEVQELIQFEITTLSSERIKVALKWSDPATETYIYDIYNALSLDWPDVGQLSMQAENREMRNFIINARPEKFIRWIENYIIIEKRKTLLSSGPFGNAPLPKIIFGDSRPESTSDIDRWKFIVTAMVKQNERDKKREGYDIVFFMVSEDNLTKITVDYDKLVSPLVDPMIVQALNTFAHLKSKVPTESQQTRPENTALPAMPAAQPGPAPVISSTGPDANEDPKDYRTEDEQKIDDACIRWAGRSILSKDMSDYLQNFYENTKIYLTKDQFKRALRDAGDRGLIVKRNRRWRLP